MATHIQPPPTMAGTDLQEIKIVSHSNLFYWWPVWAFGFIIALLTWLDGHYMVLVPKGTHAEHSRAVAGLEINDARDVLVLPKGKEIPRDPNTDTPIQPYLHAAR